MCDAVVVSDGWEFAYVQTSAVRMKEVISSFNDLGVEGWELVALDDVRRTGSDSLVATFKRRLVPFDPPADTSEGWRPDPSGRFDKRFWNGRAWTFHVGREADESVHRDPPTKRPPTPALNQ